MLSFRKECFLLSLMSAIYLILFMQKLHGSDKSPPSVSLTHPPSPEIVTHEPFAEGKSKTKIGNISVSMPVFESFDASDSSSSSEEDMEEELLSQTALSLGVPEHLHSKMSELKPYIKLLLKKKKSSPVKEFHDIIETLKKVASQQVVSQQVIKQEEMPERGACASRYMYDMNDMDDDDEESADYHQRSLFPGSALSHLHEYNHRRDDHPRYPLSIDKERMKVQQLLIEAAQDALESKEEVLKARNQILIQKEKKLDEALSRKSAAALATTSSIVTTLIGSLATYYSSK